MRYFALIGAFTLFGIAACGGAEPTQEPDPPHTEDAVAHWTCPMHPEVMEQGQTPCPMCRMDLVPVTRADLASGAVHIDPMRRQEFGIRTHEMVEQGLKVNLVGPGWVTWDANLVRDVTAPADLWIEALDLPGAGGAIEEGQALVTLKLPGGRLQTIRAPFDGVVISRAAAVGAFLEKGDPILRMGSIERVWVEAEFHEDDLPLAMPDMHGRVRAATWPVVQGERDVPPTMFKGVITERLPGLDPKTRRGRVRLEMDNPRDVLMPGLAVDVEVKALLGSSLAVPRDAVVHAGPRTLVFVDTGDHRLAPREIELGREGDGWHEVLSGLKAGEKVVASGTFLVAAESRLRSGSTFWAPGAAGD